MRTNNLSPRLQPRNSLIWRSATNSKTRSSGKWLQNMSYQNLEEKKVSEDIDMGTILLKSILKVGCLRKLSRYKWLKMIIRFHVSTKMTSCLPPNGGKFLTSWKTISIWRKFFHGNDGLCTEKHLSVWSVQNCTLFSVYWALLNPTQNLSFGVVIEMYSAILLGMLTLSLPTGGH
jgi:hypothetical protein